MGVFVRLALLAFALVALSCQVSEAAKKKYNVIADDLFCSGSSSCPLSHRYAISLLVSLIIIVCEIVGTLTVALFVHHADD
jgi:hypothetical protein